MSENTQQIDDIPALVARLEQMLTFSYGMSGHGEAAAHQAIRDAAAALSRLTRERDAARNGEDLFRAQAYAAQDALAIALRERDEAREALATCPNGKIGG